MICFLTICVVLVLNVLVKKLYKSTDIWKITLFQSDNINVSISKEHFVNFFSPKGQIRTHYHYSTGYADPFLFIREDWLYLFYEKEYLEKPAEICAYRTTNLKKWEDLGIVLKEDFHLSFPFVFESNGEIYMMPETRSIGAIRLYRSVDFPYKWEPITLIDGDKFVDSSVIQKEGIWYLFTTVWYGRNNGMHIYYSDDLSGEWNLHPLSPLHNDLAFSRCGGAVFECNGKFYRPAQNCTNYYGENVALYEIEKLSITEYSEKKICDLIDKNNKWSKSGGHHFSRAIFNGKEIVAMDGIVDDNWVNNHTRKLFNYWNRRKSK